MSKIITTAEIVLRFRSVHGDTYNYDLVRYGGAKVKVEIVCNKHGSFYQTPSNHLAGKGCPKCANEIRNKPIDPASVISRLVCLWGDRYDYNLFNYHNMHTKAKVICKEHGVFEITPTNHLCGQGCPTCASIARRHTKRVKRDALIGRFVSLWGDRYDYSLVEQHNTMRDKVTIICGEHGEFLCSVYNHLNGKGCPECAQNGYKRSKIGEFYIYEFCDILGFGISNDFVTRHKKHTTNFKKAKVKAKILKVISGDGEDILNLETRIKRHFKDKIIDTGIDGFRTEALPMHELGNLLKFIKENLPEGRFVEA